MIDSEKIDTLARLSGEKDEDVLSSFLDIAAEKIMNRCYPFGSEGRRIPARYDHLQIEIAMYLYNKQGAEGETAHNENGINRSYESASVPESMLAEVTPYASVI